VTEFGVTGALRMESESVMHRETAKKMDEDYRRYLYPKLFW